MILIDFAHHSNQSSDLADWIGIDVEGHGIDAKKGLYNFRPSVRYVVIIRIFVTIVVIFVLYANFAVRL
jgi:hypothetical protein